ncbi:MAG TPA: YggU family protein [Thermoplasmata archaeon]|jgi:uncharacterized protein (TIGR00251 family)|nr:MAG TPA: YggU family protein [Thermoplasmata archaeon]
MVFTDAVKCSKDGILIRVHVVPGSSHPEFPAGYNQWRKCIEIKVGACAKENQANAEVLREIASFFHIADHDVTLISGQKSREKTLSLKTISVESVCKKLGEVLHE